MPSLKTTVRMTTALTSVDQLNLNGYYTYQDYLTWTFPERVELVRGTPYVLSPAPNRRHQTISSVLQGEMYIFFRNSDCNLFSAPFDVRLPIPSKKRKPDTVVQHDLCVVCDREKLDKQGCNGAPDLVIEIISPSNPPREMREKFVLYQEAGVREYWLVQPAHETVIPYVLNEAGAFVGLPPRTLDDHLTSAIFPEPSIDLGPVFAYEGE